jgi:PAS domain S-box-containing protein
MNQYDDSSTIQKERNKRKIAEHALFQSNEHLSLIIESAKDYAIISMDIQRRVLSWSKGAEIMIGFSEEEMIGNSGDVIFTTNDRQYGAPEEEAAKAEKNGRAENERWHLKKNGTLFWGSGSLSSLRDKQGNLTGFVKIMRDLTETRKLEEAKFFLASIVESSNDSIITINFQREITSWNKAAENLYGYRAEEVLGKDLTILTLPVDLEQLKQNINTIQHNGAVKIFNTVRVNKDGRKMHLEIVLSPVKNSAGKVIGISTIARDITQQKSSEELIRKSEERFRTLANAVPQLIWTNDHNAKADYFNERWYNYSGLSFDKSAGVGWEAIVHPDDAPSSIQKWHESIAEGKTFESEYRLRDATGKYRWHLGRNVPLKESSGKVEGWFGSATDIENLKIAEQSSRDIADRLQLALDAGNFGSYEYDCTSGAMSSTEQHRAIHGYARNKDLTFEELKSAITPADQAKVANEFLNRSQEHATFEIEYRICLEGGAMRWVKSVGRFLFDENNRPLKIVGISVDITEQKLFTEELSKLVRERTAELQRLNSDLLEFAHVVSHDLKEPVRKILAFNNRLIQQFNHLLPENGQRYLEKIEQSSARMLSMIDGILSYSSQIAPEQSFDTVDLNEIIVQIESDLEILITNKSAVVNRTDLPSIKAIRILIHQLFYNLINNALKFSRPAVSPSITITHEFEKKDGIDFVKIHLSDNGIGFEPEFDQRIFEIFSRLNRKDEYEGTGLGLALCKKIVDRHKGFIYAAGQPGTGATFTILLPVNMP